MIFQILYLSDVNMKEKKTKTKSSTREFELTMSDLKKEKYVLRLYITGATTRSAFAISNLKKICEQLNP